VALWAYIAAGGALVGGALLLRKSKESAPATDAPAKDPCDLLPEGQARDACKALRAGLGIVAELIPDSADTTNTKLNGPAVEKIDPAVWNLITARELVSGTMSTYIHYRPLKAPYTTRYQNGFVPIEGHPDFAKGAPGSKSMVDTEWFRRFGGGVSPSSLLSGDPVRDAYTFRWPADRPWPAGAPAGAGERWAVRGQLIVCPAGTTVNNGRDHRTTPGPVCAPAVNTSAPPPVITTTTVPTSGTWTTTPSGTRDRRTDPPR
jgi:hypothetical protein